MALQEDDIDRIYSSIKAIEQSVERISQVKNVGTKMHHVTKAYVSELENVVGELMSAIRALRGEGKQ